MVARRRWGLFALGAVSLGLSACGGGGGGGGAVTPTPSPPAPLSLNGPSAPDGYQQGGGGSRHVSPATATGLQVTITDPDALTPGQVGEINFDGDETVTIQVSGQPAVTLPFVRQDTTFGSHVPLSLWSVQQGQTDTYSLSLYRPVIGTGSTAGPSRYAVIARNRLSQWRSGFGSFQVLGVPTPANAMPATLNARFDGVAVGDQMTAQAAITVTTVQGVPQIAGLISNPVGSLAPPANWQVQFSATASGAGFTGPATLSHDGISPQSGTVVGAFYGPATNPAAEIGGVWAVPNLIASFPVYGASGGFVAAR